MLRLIRLNREGDCELGPCKMQRSFRQESGGELRDFSGKEKHKVLECLEPSQSEERQVCLGGGYVVGGPGICGNQA